VEEIFGTQEKIFLQPHVRLFETEISELAQFYRISFIGLSIVKTIYHVPVLRERRKGKVVPVL
jgi:hypothetical protein